jgi:Flp pilus assembly protein TadG
MDKRTDGESGKSSGQSMVEMALLLPFLLFVIFGIIDMGWYIYGYSTVYQAARNGTQKASEIPPALNDVSPALNRSDICVTNVLSSTQSGAIFFSDMTTGTNPNNTIAISYPTGKRGLGEPIQIDITYQIQPLTPLWRFVTFGTQGTMTVRTTARRSIESLGENPNALNYVICN